MSQNENSGRLDWTRFWNTIDVPLLAELESHIGPDFDPTQQPTISGDTLFGMAASVASYRSPGFQQKYARFISLAARATFLPAQGIAYRVAEAQGLEKQEDSSNVLSWLRNAANAGSLTAFEDLARRSLGLRQEARKAFRKAGGYVSLDSADYGISVSHSDDLHTMTIETASRICDSVGSADFKLDTQGNCLLHYAALLGRPDIIKYLVTERGASIDVLNHQRETPLYTACQLGDAATVKTLVQLKANAAISSQPFHISCLHWLFNFESDEIRSVAELLIKDGHANVEARIKPHTIGLVKQHLPTLHFPFHWPFGTPFHWAIAARSHPAASVLLEHNADIDGFDFAEWDNDRQTALTLAMYRSDADMVEYLISKGANANIIDAQGRSLIHILVANYSTLNRAFRLPRSVWSWTTHGAAGNHLKQLKRCLVATLRSGVQLDHRRVRSQTALVDAIENEDACGALTLLGAGADPDVLCPTGESLLQRWLLVDGRRLDYPEMFFPVLSTLLERASNIGHHDEFAGETIIHYAVRAHCTFEQYHQVMSMLQAKAPHDCLEARNRYGETPFLTVLHFLDTEDNITISEDLVQRGANIETKSQDGEDFLHCLCSNTKFSDQETCTLVLRLLGNLEHSQQRRLVIECQSKRDGSTALMRAVRTGKLACVKLLVDFGVYINAVDTKEIRTALDWALHVADVVRSSFIENSTDMLGLAEREEAIEDHTAFNHVVSWGSYPGNPPTFENVKLMD